MLLSIMWINKLSIYLSINLFIPYSIFASLHEKLSLNSNFPRPNSILQVQKWSYIYCCKRIHVLAYFESCNGTCKFDINNDNLIYRYNQNYYRKSYLIRNAEL